MIGMPLSGWLYVSSGWSIPNNEPLVVATRYFDLFRVPALFGLPQASEDLRASVAEAAFTVHWVLAYSAIALAILHVAAALKHHFFDRDEVLAHMVPGLQAPFEAQQPPRNPVRLAILGAGLAVISIAAAGALYAATTFGQPAAPAPQAQSTFEIPGLPPVIAPPTAPAPTVTPPVAAPGAPSAPPPITAWRVDPRASAIGFAFTFTDEESGETRFEGRFTRWRADIRFDPANLDLSSAMVLIETASATDGVQLHDNALPDEPWFNAANYPTAAFRATEIRREGDGYVARGELTIKGRARPVELPFNLVISGDAATMTGRLVIDRHDFDIGQRTEADGMISREIEINVRVEAVRAS
jgi:cytochrome b561